MSSKTPSDEQYAKFGREIEKILLKSYGELLSWPKMIGRSFVKGMFAGLGGVIGATLMLALLLFILRSLGDLPWVGQFFEQIRRNIQP